jgi:hypothetical protein
MRMAQAIGLGTMRKRIASLSVRCVALAIPMLMGSVTVADGQSSAPCFDSTTTRVQNYKSGYANMVSNPDTAFSRQRTNLGLPLLAANQVRIVGDTATCRVASSAYDSALGRSPSTVPVVVLELGTRRVVVKDIGMRGAWMNLLFNQDFSTLLQKIWY